MTSPSFRFGSRSAGVGDRELVRGLLVLLVGHDRPAAERLVVAGLAVDRHARVDLVREALLGRRRERRLERREDDVLRHVLLARERVHQQQQFAVHLAFLHSIFGTRRARSMSASGIVTRALRGFDEDRAALAAAQHALACFLRVRDRIGEPELGFLAREAREIGRLPAAAGRDPATTPRAGRSRCSRRRTAASGGC